MTECACESDCASRQFETHTGLLQLKYKMYFQSFNQSSHQLSSIVSIKVIKDTYLQSVWSEIDS